MCLTAADPGVAPGAPRALIADCAVQSPHLNRQCVRGQTSACRTDWTAAVADCLRAAAPGVRWGGLKPPPNSSELSPDLGAGCSRILTYDELTTRPHAVVRLLRKRRGRCGVSRQRGGGRWPRSASAAPKLQSIESDHAKGPQQQSGRGKVKSPVSPAQNTAGFI